MMKNLEVLATLRESIQQQQKENENIINETTQKHLQNLNESLIASFNQRLDSIQSYTTEYLKESINPTALKTKTLALTFLSGMLVMMILCLIAWYQWIRPYQVSRENVKPTSSGQNYIVMPKNQAIQQDNLIALPIR